ncbi:hypothetical protein H0O01_04275 [Candidatus Micrarchaeota archaeon]|nr:hypothetical protein [Candidatus Micrarchaeota archaeon]
MADIARADRRCSLKVNVMGISVSVSKGMDILSEVAKRTMEFQKLNFVEYLKYYVVSALLAFAGVLVALIPAAIMFFVVLSSVAVGPIAIVGAILLVMVMLAIMLAGSVFSTSAMFASIRFAMNNGQKEKYLQNRDYKPSLGYVIFYGLVMLAAYVIFLGVPMFLMFGSLLTPIFAGQYSDAAAGMMVGGMMLGYLLFFVGIFAFIIFLYAFQLAFVYGIYEIAADGLAPVAALKRSYALLKANFWETLVLLVGLFAIGNVAGMVLNIVLLPLILISVFFPPFLVVAIPVLFVLSLAVEAALAPITIFFWQKIRTSQAA